MLLHLYWSLSRDFANLVRPYKSKVDSPSFKKYYISLQSVKNKKIKENIERVITEAVKEDIKNDIVEVAEADLYWAEEKLDSVEEYEETFSGL